MRARVRHTRSAPASIARCASAAASASSPRADAIAARVTWTSPAYQPVPGPSSAASSASASSARPSARQDPGREAAPEVLDRAARGGPAGELPRAGDRLQRRRVLAALLEDHRLDRERVGEPAERVLAAQLRRRGAGALERGVERAALEVDPGGPEGRREGRERGAARARHRALEERDRLVVGAGRGERRGRRDRDHRRRGRGGALEAAGERDRGVEALADHQRVGQREPRDPRLGLVAAHLEADDGLAQRPRRVQQAAVAEREPAFEQPQLGGLPRRAVDAGQPARRGRGRRVGDRAAVPRDRRGRLLGHLEPVLDRLRAAPVLVERPRDARVQQLAVLARALLLEPAREHLPDQRVHGDRPRGDRQRDPARGQRAREAVRRLQRPQDRGVEPRGRRRVDERGAELGIERRQQALERVVERLAGRGRPAGARRRGRSRAAARRWPARRPRAAGPEQRGALLAGERELARADLGRGQGQRLRGGDRDPQPRGGRPGEHGHDLDGLGRELLGVVDGDRERLGQLAEGGGEHARGGDGADALGRAGQRRGEGVRRAGRRRLHGADDPRQQPPRVGVGGLAGDPGDRAAAVGERRGQRGRLAAAGRRHEHQRAAVERGREPPVEGGAVHRRNPNPRRWGSWTFWS